MHPAEPSYSARFFHVKTKDMTAPATSEEKTKRQPEEQTLSEVVVRFAGDSGDGMQLTGTQFTNTSALLGNDLSTLPDFPAEIRAPAGTLPGVSAFQVRIADHEIHTPRRCPGCADRDESRGVEDKPR